MSSLQGTDDKEALDQWLSGADAAVAPPSSLSCTITKHRTRINNALDSGLSNTLVESTNTKIRTLTRVAFGFCSATPLIDLAMLALGGTRTTLSGR